jgi:hypothetical protein
MKVLYLPPGTYSITKTVFILPSVELTQDGWLRNMISNVSAPTIQFLEFSQASRVQVDANNRTGILIGNYSNPYSSAQFGTIKVINAGNIYGQYAVRITGFNVAFNNIETTHGNIGLDINNASDIRGVSVFIINAITGIRAVGSEHIQFVNVDCDSSRYCSIQIDASHDIIMSGTIWFNKEVYPDNPLYGIMLGNYSECKNLNLDFGVIGCAQTGVRMDKINDSIINVLMSNGPLYTPVFPIKTGVVYGCDGKNIGNNVIQSGIINKTISIPKIVRGIWEVHVG